MASVESQLKQRIESCTERQAREMALLICEQVRQLANHALCSDLVRLGQQRMDGVRPEDSDDIRMESVAAYDSMYSGEGAPSAQALAFSAFGETAFTTDAWAALSNTGSLVAHAVALFHAEQADPDLFDRVFESAYTAERTRQLELVRSVLER